MGGQYLKDAAIYHCIMMMPTCGARLQMQVMRQPARLDIIIIRVQKLRDVSCQRPFHTTLLGQALRVAWHQ
jgi:hypothetical protein